MGDILVSEFEGWYDEGGISVSAGFRPERPFGFMSAVGGKADVEFGLGDVRFLTQKRTHGDWLDTRIPLTIPAEVQQLRQRVSNDCGLLDAEVPHAQDSERATRPRRGVSRAGPAERP